MPTYVAVIGVVQYQDKILFLKRNPERKFAPGRWEFVSGRLRNQESVDEAIVREAKEETNLKCEIVKRGEIAETQEPTSTWILIPFLLVTDNPEVTIGHEHTEYRWVSIEDTDQYEHVSGVNKVFQSLGLKKS